MSKFIKLQIWQPKRWSLKHCILCMHWKEFLRLSHLGFYLPPLTGWLRAWAKIHVAVILRYLIWLVYLFASKIRSATWRFYKELSKQKRFILLSIVSLSRKVKLILIMLQFVCRIAYIQTRLDYCHWNYYTDENKLRKMYY